MGALFSAGLVTTLFLAVAGTVIYALIGELNFEAQVGPFMSEAHEFEIAPRRRAVFDAIAWRKGLTPLPRDSADVV